MDEATRLRVFEAELKPLLGLEFERALNIRAQLGDYWTWNMNQILAPAARQGRVREVLALLESHAEAVPYSKRFDGEIRPEVDKQTEQLFRAISSSLLHLNPAR